MAKAAVVDGVINGVDVKAVGELIKAIQEKPELAKCNFRAQHKWISGGHSQTRIKDFYGAEQVIAHNNEFVVSGDEPPILAGGDQGANPVEYLLHALAGCVTTTFAYHAAVRGIKIDELEAQIDGDLDLRGFLGITDEVRGGYESIRVKYKVKTDEANLEKLRALTKLSPVLDVTANGTNVEVTVERK